MSWLCADILSGRSEFQKKITVKFLGLQIFFEKSAKALDTTQKEWYNITRNKEELSVLTLPHRELGKYFSSPAMGEV